MKKILIKLLTFHDRKDDSCNNSIVGAIKRNLSHGLKKKCVNNVIRLYKMCLKWNLTSWQDKFLTELINY